MVFKRMSNMISATIHDSLDQMENPRMMLNQYLRNMEDEIHKAKQNVVKQQTMEQSFQRKMSDANAMVQKRKSQAEIAFDAGEENLARSALSEMKHYEAQTEQYEDLHKKAVEQVRELREQLSELEGKFQQLKDKKHALVARANAANAKQQMNISLNKVDSYSAVKEFERMEDRIQEMEVSAQVWDDSYSQQHHNRYMTLEYADEADEALEKMRVERQQKTIENDSAEG